MTFAMGAHVGQQNLTMDELRATWRRIDAAGLDWISAWDHLYEAPPADGTLPHFEAVATLAALALETTNARIGCLVFYVGYRNPGVLAKAAVTLDHLSGGRFELGLGAGWHQWEAEAFGFDFPPVGTRLSMLEEATELIRSLLSRERTDYDGRHFRAVNASCLPPPVQEHLPIWIGGVGEKRTLRTTARLADGWNAAYIGPDRFRELNGVLDHWCEVEDRDPDDIERSVNLMFLLSPDQRSADEAADAFERQWGEMAGRVREGVLMGTPEQAVERILQYREAGADLVNVALRAPWNDEALEAYLMEVTPAVRRG
jgi:alkanesulfonate monooxygenase SsuD/methylene tetrahydromethanopterin reductase-like flavin-dependent oxidoreductase (luciferase family)